METVALQNWAYSADTKVLEDLGIILLVLRRFTAYGHECEGVVTDIEWE